MKGMPMLTFHNHQQFSNSVLGVDEKQEDESHETYMHRLTWASAEIFPGGATSTFCL